MAEPETPAETRWAIHDEQVRDRRRSGWRFFRYGLLLFLIGFLYPLFGWLVFASGIGLLVMAYGLVKALFAGRLSADAIREVQARRAK